MKIPACSLFVFLFFSSHFLSAKENSDSTKNKEKEFLVYNGIGVGFAEFTGILSDHINFCKGNFVFGASGRISSRKYWRNFYSAFSRYNEYKFVDELALLGGYQIFNKESIETRDEGNFLGGKKNNTKFVLNAGPIMRYEKARYWPDKGSGIVPFIGVILDRKKVMMPFFGALQFLLNFVIWIQIRREE